MDRAASVSPSSSPVRTASKQAQKKIHGNESAEEATLGDETTSAAAQHFVIDRQTGELLAQQSVTLRDVPLIPKGTVVSSMIYEQAWTNQTPEPSPGCSDGS